MTEQVTFKCLRCGHEFRGVYDTDVERMCPKCRSNSVRRVKEKPPPKTEPQRTAPFISHMGTLSSHLEMLPTFLFDVRTLLGVG